MQLSGYRPENLASLMQLIKQINQDVGSSVAIPAVDPPPLSPHGIGQWIEGRLKLQLWISTVGAKAQSFRL